MERKERGEREDEEEAVGGQGREKKMEGEEANALRQLLKEVKKGENAQLEKETLANGMRR